MGMYISDKTLSIGNNVVTLSDVKGTPIQNSWSASTEDFIVPRKLRRILFEENIGIKRRMRQYGLLKQNRNHLIGIYRKLYYRDKMPRKYRIIYSDAIRVMKKIFESHEEM